MGYSKKVISDVRAQFQQKREKNENRQNIHLNRVYSLCPEIKSIDNSLKTTVSQIAGAIKLGKEECAKEIEKIKIENLALQKGVKNLFCHLDFQAIIQV